MKITITKSSPYNFPRAGMHMLSVWKGTPYFSEGHHSCPEFGVHDISYGKWQGDFLMDGRSFRKLATQEIKDDVWEALKFSYAFDQGQYPYDNDIYDPVDDYYRAAENYYRFEKPGCSKWWNPGQTPLNEKLQWYREDKAIKYASKIVEKEGQRWWEWKLHYDLELVMSKS